MAWKPSLLWPQLKAEWAQDRTKLNGLIEEPTSGGSKGGGRGGLPPPPKFAWAPPIWAWPMLMKMCIFQVTNFKIFPDSLTGSLDFYEMNSIYFYANKLQVGFPTTQFCQKVLMGVEFFCNFAAHLLKNSNAYCSIQLSRIFPDSLTHINFPTTHFYHKSFAKPAEWGS